LLALAQMGCSEDYKPTICTAINFNLLDCVPTDRSVQRFDLKTTDVKFLGMSCMFDEDVTEGRKRARRIIEGLEFNGL